MWRKLLESTEVSTTKESPKVVVINAPSSIKITPRQPEFTGIGFTHDTDIDIYWLNDALNGSVEADLRIYCIDWQTKSWNLEEFITLQGPKVLHVYNYDSQSFEIDAEFIQQYLRLVCIEADSALAFVIHDWKPFLLGELGLAPVVQADVVTRIVIPRGWDSKAKILATREDFPVDKDWRTIELPKRQEILMPEIADQVEPIEMSRVLAAIKGEKQEKEDLSKVFSYLMDKASSE